MASLTPGTLVKLLQSMSNSNSKPKYSDHRSPVLQITAILPSTSDLLPSSNYFYIQLSDSLNSTYVSVSLSDRNPDTLHLGQLVHLDRLIPAHPLPLVANLRPISFVGRSPPGICGSPSPLTALSSPSDPSNFVIQPSSLDLAPPVMAAGAAGSVKENVAAAVPTVKRRFSSPTVTKRRDPSPAAVGKRSSSPVPSKCVVPSLVVAKEENRRVSREAAIVVPSRYRQPSPVNGGRRGSISPMSRRLSGSGESTGGGRKKVGMLGSGRAVVRKSWEGEEKSGVKIKMVDQKAILRAQVAISQRLSDAAREPPNIEEESPKIEKQKTIKKMEPSPKEESNHAAANITVHDRKWTDGSIPLDTVSENLARLGKEALQRRNVASIAAAEALEEALATESIIRCLSMFSDLCSSSKAENPLPIIEKFLSIYNDTTKWISISESLASRNTNAHNESIQIDKSKSASLWVDAALSTNLEVVALLNNLDISSKHKFSSKSQMPIAESPRTTVSKRNTWTRGQSVGENVNFAKSLRREMQNWFMKFVENALDVGFRLFGEVEGLSKDNGRVAAVLSHLKRVNDWLDEVGKKKDEELSLVEKIERLKRKIYGFVITHVGSAFDSSVSLSK